MSLVAIRINTVVGAPSPAFDEEGNPVNEDDWEFDDSEEDLIYVDTEDVMDIENGIADVKDAIWHWSSPSDKKPEATET